MEGSGERTDRLCFLSLSVQVARKVWLGKWNTKRDREPDKSDETGFKSFLISKYEKRTWYVDPKEVVKEEKTTPKLEPKLAPPPSTKVQLSLYVLTMINVLHVCRPLPLLSVPGEGPSLE